MKRIKPVDFNVNSYIYTIDFSNFFNGKRASVRLSHGRLWGGGVRPDEKGYCAHPEKVLYLCSDRVQERVCRALGGRKSYLLWYVPGLVLAQVRLPKKGGPVQ